MAWESLLLRLGWDGNGEDAKNWLKLVECSGTESGASSCAIELAPIVFSNSASFPFFKKGLVPQ